MDIEQLKLVLSTLLQLGEGSKEVAIWWLMLDKVLPVVVWLLILGAVVYLVLRIIPMLTLSDPICELRDRLGIGSSGSHSNWERRETFKRLNKLVDEHLKKQ